MLRVELVDTPVGFLRTLGGGVKDLFYLPAKAVVRSRQDRRALAKAVRLGGQSFARGVMLAPVRPAGKMASALLRTTDRALAAMALSKAAGPHALSQPGGVTGRRMIRQGAAGLGLGVVKGVTGIVYEPYRGARRDGARGFALGVGKGLAGAALRPTRGVLKLADRWAGAWVRTTEFLTGDLGADGGLHGQHGQRFGRVRPPRMLHDGQQRLSAFSMAEALARHVLTSTEDGKYLSEPLLHCDLLLESLSAEAGASSSKAAAQCSPVVAVLTGMRLLAVDSAAWRVLLNVPLRKLQAVSHDEQNVLLLRLKPRRAVQSRTDGTAGKATGDSQALVSSSGAPAATSHSGEITRRLPCHTEEAVVALQDHLKLALDSLNARRRVWHARYRHASGELYPPLG